jgi:hypothetical protein
MQNQRMRASYVPVMHCEKITVTECLMKVGVIEFLVTEGNSAAVICERLRGVYGDVCMGTSSVRTDIADQPRCGRQSTAATERKKSTNSSDKTEG